MSKNLFALLCLVSGAFAGLQAESAPTTEVPSSVAADVDSDDDADDFTLFDDSDGDDADLVEVADNDSDDDDAE